MTDSNSVIYDAAKHEIDSVTVFTANNAEITRKVQVDLKQGQNEIAIRNLPSALEGNSIRVDSPRAVVFDVIHKPAGTIDHPPSMDTYTNHGHAHRRSESILPDTPPEIATLREQKACITHERRIIEEQQNILKTYANSLPDSAVNSEVLSQFLDLYAGRQMEFYSKRHALEGQEGRLRNEIREAEKVEAKRNADRRLGTIVVAIVYAEQEMKSDLEFVYNVRDAYWTPIYSLRATIPDSGPASVSIDDKLKRQSSTTVATSVREEVDWDQGLKGTISLHYRASISQWTGEDWRNVQLILSTASPQLGSTVPHMKSVRLDEIQYSRDEVRHSKFISSRPIVIREHSGISRCHRSRSRSRSPRSRSRSRSRSHSPRTVIVADRTPRAPRVTTTSYGFTAAFTVQGFSNIPSNSLESNESHKVTVSIIDLSEVSLEWVTVPRENTKVFMKAQVKNTSDFTLLPGEASIFLNNNFAATSSIPLVSPLEHFSVFLGIDPSIRVTYHPLTKKVNNPTGGMINLPGISTSGSKQLSAFNQRITVKNTRRIPLSRLIVKDRVPVSTNAQIKVNMRVPSLPELPTAGGTDKSKKGKQVFQEAVSSEVSVAVGGSRGKGGSNAVTARWSPANEDVPIQEEDVGAGNGSANVNTEGFMEWICRDMEAGSTLELELGWDVITPKGMRWVQTPS